MLNSACSFQKNNLTLKSSVKDALNLRSRFSKCFPVLNGESKKAEVFSPIYYVPELQIFATVWSKTYVIELYLLNREPEHNSENKSIYFYDVLHGGTR
jgi:hypothetical protein